MSWSGQEGQVTNVGSLQTQTGKTLAHMLVIPHAIGLVCQTIAQPQSFSVYQSDIRTRVVCNRATVQWDAGQDYVRTCLAADKNNMLGGAIIREGAGTVTLSLSLSLDCGDYCAVLT